MQKCVSGMSMSTEYSTSGQVCPRKMILKRLTDGLVSKFSTSEDHVQRQAQEPDTDGLRPK